MTAMLGSLTVIAVIRHTAPLESALERWGTMLEHQATDFEIVLVANGTAPATTLAIKTLAGRIPDLTVVFLAETVHDDIARLVGIEHAIGDHVLFADPARDDPASIPPLLHPLRQGYDLVIADRGDERPRRSRRESAMIRLFGAAYRSTTGRIFDIQPTGLRVLSRAAALNVAGQADAELRLRMRTIGAGFPAILVPLAPPPDRRTATKRHINLDRRTGHGWIKGVGLLLSTSTLPLRGASYAALAGGALSVLYSLYVCAIYLLKPNVAAGWTTLSLQVSAMMLVFSIVLLFLSEYVIQIFAANPPRSRRHLVVRELRSPLSRRASRLNVVDAEGRFELGKPAWLIGQDA